MGNALWPKAILNMENSNRAPIPIRPDYYLLWIIPCISLLRPWNLSVAGVEFPVLILTWHLPTPCVAELRWAQKSECLWKVTGGIEIWSDNCRLTDGGDMVENGLEEVETGKQEYSQEVIAANYMKPRAESLEMWRKWCPWVVKKCPWDKVGGTWNIIVHGGEGEGKSLDWF